MVHDIGAFALAALVLLVIPGPAVLYVVGRSLADGPRTGLAAVVGLEVGNFLHVLAATAGLSAVIATSAAAFTVVKWTGAVYLVAAGAWTLVRGGSGSGADGEAPPPTSARRALASGIVVNALNPKVALFFLAFLPQFIDPSRGSVARQSLLLGSIFVLLGCATDSLYAILAGTFRRAVADSAWFAAVRRWGSGSVFVILGLAAARATRAT